MSDAPDEESKEHDASEEKLRQARERGDMPTAPDVWLFGSFLAIGTSLNLLGRVSTEGPVRALGNLLEFCSDIRVSESGDALRIFHEISGAVAVQWAMAVATLCLIAIATGSLSQPPRASWRRLKFEIGRLDPVKGVGRIFGGKALAAFVRATLKMVVASAALSAVLASQWRRLAGATEREALSTGADILNAVTHITMTMAAVAALFAVLDFVLSRRRWKKKLRMTRQEVKEEAKRAEGDPHVKMRMRSIALDRARKRMLTDVSSATMVIVNPTHYALALRYRREEGGAPVVVAKGQELIALKIRTEAADHRIPVIEQPELARAMYRSVDVGQAIPVEFYRAVAEIINFLSTRPISASAPG
ncbi:MAG TPA: EscU/YscU/HrcU family type III secretion system export apparatus switch protein [Rhodoblastus sp.]|nr:EscU/YscU/HrcU family type III secretion system export apparatus switch protein [Rhodoblastus sp.]